ncbi:TniQ family protein [Paraliobacillus quinghaiensis]|uniref:TniQ family protein n=1 Tax=Paraliobacillus quinghaiensis TaxID=470815 RepID=UPI0013C31B39|nr:TniQ family protein [Paraliobacillus quinghaiensis]
MENIIENKFTVRPKPLEGESLTGYFMRLAKNNYLSLDEFFYIVKSDYKKSSRQLHITDTLPEKVMNIELLKKILKCCSSDIEKMSFTNVFYLFFNDKEEALSNYRSVMPEMIEKEKRKFCSYCLEETGTYKLVWQLKDIQVCDIHQIKLQSKCPSCSNEQPYVSLELANYSCHFCHSPLTTPSIDTTYSDIALINDQLQKYQDWNFLMTSDITLSFENIPGLHKEKQLAISFIYLFTGKENTFDMKTIPKTERSYIRGLLRFLNNGGSRLKVTLRRLFRLIEHSKTSMREFSEMRVPESFIKSLKLTPYKKEVGPCLCSWCKSNKSDKSIKELTNIEGNNSYKFVQVSYSKISVCLDCFTRHGYNDQNKWVSIKMGKNTIGVNVELAEKILYLFKAGLLFTQVKGNVNVSRFSCYYAVAYLVNQGAIPLQYYMQKDVIKPKELVECFKKLVSSYGEKRQKAKELFNWTAKEYYYFLTTKEVQTFLLMESYRIKKLSRIGSSSNWRKKVSRELKKQVQAETKITIKGVANALGCSLKGLQTNNLRGMIVAAREQQKQLYIKSFTDKTKKNVKKYLDGKLDLLEEISSVKEIYICVEKNENWVRRNIPELHNWIVNKKREVNIIIKKRSQINYKRAIEEAVDFHIANGIEPTFERVLNHIGFNMGILQKRPIIRDMIMEARTKLGTIQKQR